MIRLIKKGLYTIERTLDKATIFTLDSKMYSVLKMGELTYVPRGFGEKEKTKMLAKGIYRLYEVKQEPDFPQSIHLELIAGAGKSLGYLLPSGLPTTKKPVKKIEVKDAFITKTIL